MKTITIPLENVDSISIKVKEQLYPILHFNKEIKKNDLLPLTLVIQLKENSNQKPILRRSKK
jgi:hypothetical protein